MLAGLFLHYGDLTDSSNLCAIIARTRPDEVYNLGAQSHVKVSCLICTPSISTTPTLRLHQTASAQHRSALPLSHSRACVVRMSAVRAVAVAGNVLTVLVIVPASPDRAFAAASVWA